ncbi:MAG: DUF1573 domain-containing protein [Desulfosoma sp.]
MKGLTFVPAIFSVMFVSFMASADSTPPTSTPSEKTDTPRIIIENPVVDLGEVMENGTVSHDFVVRNTGTAPLSIEQVRPG